MCGKIRPSHLSFAWEDENSSGKNIIDKAIDCTHDTNVLVVIGYTFPFFNREIDRKIISKMDKLERVYFQDKEPEKIRRSFMEITKNLKVDDLILDDDLRAFPLPNELEL